MLQEVLETVEMEEEEGALDQGDGRDGRERRPLELMPVVFYPENVGGQLDDDLGEQRGLESRKSKPSDGK